MPKYTFKCRYCGKEVQKYVSTKIKITLCECKGAMDRQMPKLSGIQTNEVADKYSNVRLANDHKEVLKERKSDYYWAHIVPDLVNSGTYTLETMLEQNWVYYNERGELTTRTKPPEKS